MKQLSTPRGTLYSKGRHLYDARGKQVILRGINLALLDDWDFPQSNQLAELAKTNANAVRIQWYRNYGQPDRPTYSIQDLDHFLLKCKVNRMIPILGLWDYSCHVDITLLNTHLMP